MPLRNSKPLTVRPTTVCDSQDMTNGPSGGMAALTNLIPNPMTDKTWVPRPAAQLKSALVGVPSPGFGSGELIIGNTAYLMVASSLNPGFDQPVVVDLTTGSTLMVSGITPENVPSSPPTTGPWVPPILALVGTRVVVTHPGFTGGAGPFFGWFDISSFSEVTAGNTHSSILIDGNPFILGVQAGMVVAGPGIPADAVVVATANFVLDTTGTTTSNIHLTGLASTAGVVVGQTVAGEGIPIGATVTTLVSSSAVDISIPATASNVGVAITFAGATITLSDAATASANGVGLTILGGTPAAPQWGAGNTNGNPLPQVPVSVAQMAGSAFYAVASGVVISDPLLATQVTNASQAITFGNGLAVTALGALPLNSLLGGIVQAIIAFQGVSAMQQITGAFSTSNLTDNQLPIETGTLAPLSIAATSKGLAFVSPEGLRFINFACQVGDPIGDAGQGITAPFIFTTTPSRICATAQANTLRISVINALALNVPTQEFWWDFTRQTWSGPHTFPASLIQPWQNTFIMFPSGILGQLWQSDAAPNNDAGFTENGQQIGCLYATSLLPDNQAMAENAIVESALMLALPVGSQAAISAIADDGTALDSQIIQGFGGKATIWGQFIWGEAFWGGAGVPPLIQRQIPWSQPLVFKQAGFTVSVNAGPGIVLGDLYLRYQILGYLLERVA